MKNLTFKTTKALMKLVDQHDFRKYLTYVYYSKKSDSILLSDGHILIILTENKSIDLGNADFSDLKALDKDVLNKLVFHKQELNILDVLEKHNIDITIPNISSVFKDDFLKNRLIPVNYRISCEYLKNIYALVESLKEPQERKEKLYFEYLGTYQNRNYLKSVTNNYLVFACIANIITN